ncbi:transglutaminase domain-containing protein [Paenibacillus illinoisensis]|uniref:Transglutaminase domain-containing protein n=1 Tax=Paenibacillus illinoisensis TaxID=59845 RepID=A0A2W0CZC6_9BACL|nr:transglutaminase domain-containing protein [Paenibacillus illinoisensis]PYY29021.1 Transglutaminase domain-containing protein [Paenibacillus illinoisensis]
MSVQTSAFSLTPEEMKSIEDKLRIKRRLVQAQADEIFSVFREPLSVEEEWALKFVYAYSPLQDLADVPGALFLSHVRSTLRMRREVPWGQRVPDDLFLHFVLPCRVNTENIEDCRAIFYAELADRIMSLTMSEAILETNYWCHEKAVYTGSDLRTVSPLTMIRSARGRCGEESTLAVTALRSIGIPARQVYTPRWAHCDDNHAWVEAWADGTWHYIGACEPEARLNQGWFTPPARRSMLMNTRVLGAYHGPEDVTLATEWYTELNLLENYAPTKELTVAVKDLAGVAVEGAAVRFELYNMAEFYPIAELLTNEDGEVVFKTGYGDLLVRAVYQGRWLEHKITIDQTDRLELVLDLQNQHEQESGVIDFDMVPPPETEGEELPALTGEAESLHKQRLSEGTDIRTAFEATFVTDKESIDLSRELSLPEARVWDVMQKARGNGHEIAAFLRESSPEHGQWPLLLLESLNSKDLIDTFRPVLHEHLAYSLPLRGMLPDTLFIPYLLCPRVAFEMLGPYRKQFQAAFASDERDAIVREPSLLAEALKEKFIHWEDLPNLKGKGTAAGTYRIMAGDEESLAILFVALCRSLGIPSRLHPSERKPQYWQKGSWIFADLVNKEKGKQRMGSIRLVQNESGGNMPEASYYENISIARLVQGKYVTLHFPYKETKLFDEPLPAEEGAYRMTTGVRLKNGTVRARFTYFDLKEGEESCVAVTFRSADEEIPVLGTVDKYAELRWQDENVTTLERSVSGTAAGILLSWIEPDREPTMHLLKELADLKQELVERNISVVLITGSAGTGKSLKTEQLEMLPSQVRLGEAAPASLPEVFRSSGATESGYPHLVVLDKAYQIRYVSSGYRIGAVKEALQVSAQLAGQRSEPFQHDGGSL